jgi:hypothetical protein
VGKKKNKEVFIEDHSLFKPQIKRLILVSIALFENISKTLLLENICRFSRKI